MTPDLEAIRARNEYRKGKDADGEWNCYDCGHGCEEGGRAYDDIDALLAEVERLDSFADACTADVVALKAEVERLRGETAVEEPVPNPFMDHPDWKHREGESMVETCERRMRLMLSVSLFADGDKRS